MFMFFRSYETMLEPLKWLATVNIFKYGSEILVANEYKGLKFECPPGDYYICYLIQVFSLLLLYTCTTVRITKFLAKLLATITKKLPQFILVARSSYQKAKRCLTFSIGLSLIL